MKNSDKTSELTHFCGSQEFKNNIKQSFNQLVNAFSSGFMF